MTKGNKIILGIFTFLPFLILMFYFLGAGILLKNAIIKNPNDDFIPIIGDIIWVVSSALFLGLLSFGLLIYYIVHAINNREIDSNERLLWVLVFVLGSIAGFPIYWYLRIWKRHEVLTMSAT
jgi:hypothetical protein